MNKTHLEQFIKTLNAMDGLLEKAAGYADHKKFDVNNFLSQRLAPDMLPFVKQVQIACDAAKFATAYLSQTIGPKFEDNEATWSELRARVKGTAGYLKTMLEADFSGYKTVKVSPTWAKGQWLTGEEYFHQLALPNFYFHVSAVYAILRAGGVEIGKQDYLGGVPFRQP